MTKVVTTDNSGNITCAAEICDLISDCASIPHNKSLKVVGTELQLTDTLNGVVKCDVSGLINTPVSESVTNVRLYTDGKLLKLEDSAGNTLSNNMVSNAQACLPDLTYSFLPDTSKPIGALMLLDANGKPAKRTDLSNLVDGSTVTYNATTGKLSATGGSTPPTPTYIKQSDIPTSINDDTKALVPAAVLAMLQYLRPTSSTSGLTAKQLSANAIDCQVFSNVTCDGSGNVTSFKIPKPGSSTDMCTVTIPTSAGGGGTTFPTTVWEGASKGCVNVPDPGIYYAELNTRLGSYFIPFVNVGNLPADTAPVNNAGFPDAWQRCLVLVVEPNTTEGSLNPSFYTGGIAAGRVKANSKSYYPITKIVRVC
jgi:hypothetical protein